MAILIKVTVIPSGEVVAIDAAHIQQVTSREDHSVILFHNGDVWMVKENMDHIMVMANT